MWPAVPTTTGWMARPMSVTSLVHVQDALAGAALDDRGAAQQARIVVGRDRRVATLADGAFDGGHGDPRADLEQALVLGQQVLWDALGQRAAPALDRGRRLAALVADLGRLHLERVVDLALLGRR